MLAGKNKSNLVHHIEHVEDLEYEFIGQVEQWRRHGERRIVQLIFVSSKFEASEQYLLLEE